MKLELKPYDVLFFRDAKPMSAGEGYGNGCRMPFPSSIHAALRTSILKNANALPSKRIDTRHSRDVRKAAKSGISKRIGVDKYGSLQIKSMFVKHVKYGVLFPLPIDVLTADESGVSITKLGRIGGRIVPLATVPPSKKRVAGFWTVTQIRSYLASDCSGVDMTPVSVDDVWQPEWKVGVEIVPKTQANQEGQLYAGEYMRLNDAASFVVDVSLQEAEELAKIHTVTLGGERRVCDVQESDFTKLEWTPRSPSVATTSSGYLVKWILLSPALFAGGSTPGWVHEGRVKLRPKFKGERMDLDNSTLLAACTGNPIPFSGWDPLEGQAKPSVLAVPAGAVYYFRCPDETSAQALASALNDRCRSDMLAEKGFGFGVTIIEKLELINEKEKEIR